MQKSNHTSLHGAQSNVMHRLLSRFTFHIASLCFQWELDAPCWMLITNRQKFVALSSLVERLKKGSQAVKCQ